MPLIAQATVQGYIDVGNNAANTAEQGRALEDLVCYVYGLVPGLTITHRNELNAFQTEEIDVALWNDGSPDGFFFLPNIILVECKNWSTKVGSSELNWFDSKLRNRGLSFGIFVATRGITGDAADLTAAHTIIAAALREGRCLILITTTEIATLTDSSQLVHLIKQKLCDLAVRGTVG